MISADGPTLTFVVPAEQDECHPSGNPCLEIRNIPVTVGVYDVYVINANGTSNKLKFTVQNKQQMFSWIWENLGCGSSAPCSYRVCSLSNPENCYLCSGKYNKLSPEGEKVPQKDENPQTTTNFTCKYSQVEYSCRVPCTGAVPSSRVEQDCFKLLSQGQCTSYTSDEFPFRCEWRLINYQCPPVP